MDSLAPETFPFTDVCPEPSKPKPLWGPFFYFDLSQTQERCFPSIRWGYHYLTILPFWCCVAISGFHLPYFYSHVLPGVPDSSRLFVRLVYTFFWFIHLLHFLLTYWTNPGILPWNWSQTRKRSYTDNEIRDGIATTREQVLWARNHDRPGRAYFSRKQGYFILRGDHYCNWTTTWIGINNHRHFIRASYYTVLYVLFLLYWTGKVYSHDAIVGNTKVCLVYAGVLAFLGVFTAVQAVSQTVNVSHNQTISELLTGVFARQPNTFNRGCVRNWEEVCGSRYYCPMWLCPCPIPRVEDGFGYEFDRNSLQPFLAFAI
jgi:hypothetical protein